MSVDLLFRIGGIGILVALVVQLLKQTGRDEIATIAALAGLVITMIMVINVISTLFDSVKQIFQLY